MKQVSTLAMNSRLDLDIKVTAASRPIRLFIVLSTIVFLGIILDYNFIQSPFLSPELYETTVAKRMLLWLIMGLTTLVLIIALEIPRMLVEKKISRASEIRNNLKFLEETNEKVLLKKTLGGDFDCVKIFENFKFGALTSDKRGKIKTANSAFCKQTGYSASELIGQNICDVLKGSMSNAKDGKSSISEHELLYKNGNKERYYASSFPLYDGANQMAGTASVVFGIAEMPNYQNHLEKMLKAEQEWSTMRLNFVKQASHEFRTPLSIIQSNVELIALSSSAETSPSSRIKFEKRIINEIDYMTTLMDKVLILERIGSGYFKPECNPVNLVDILKEIQTQTNKLQKDGRGLDLEISGNVESANLDRQLLQHAIINVVSNAFKYSQAESPKMSVKLEKDRTTISVEDSGIGIPETDQKKIFQPFYRADNVTKYRGAGLGLNIAKEFIEMLGGYIEIESKEKAGTKVIISIPHSVKKAKKMSKSTPYSFPQTPLVKIAI